jgi:hypothetical protein
VVLQATQPSCGSLAAAVEIVLQNLDNPRLSSFGYLLNTVLPVTLPAPASSPPLKAKSRDQLLRLLMLAMIRHMVAKFPALIIIDDAQYLNPSSWEFALQVAVDCCSSDAQPSDTPLMLVIATRPIASYLDVITSRVPESFTTLSEAPFVEFIRLARLAHNVRSCVSFP